MMSTHFSFCELVHHFHAQELYTQMFGMTGVRLQPHISPVFNAFSTVHGQTGPE